MELWNLLVPNATCGGSPHASSAGTVMSPPPPAMASMNPPASPAKNKKMKRSGVMGKAEQAPLRRFHQQPGFPMISRNFALCARRVWLTEGEFYGGKNETGDHQNQ